MKPDLAVIEKPVCQDLIKQIEDTLEQAKRGEIHGWVCIKSYSDNSTNHNWAGIKDNAVRITGELFCAANEIAENINHCN